MRKRLRLLFIVCMLLAWLPVSSTAMAKTVSLAKPTASVATYDLSKIKVSWKKVKNAKGYYVYRATSKNGKYTKIKTASSSVTSYVDTNRALNQKYYYKVTAYNGKKTTTSSVLTGKAGLAKPVIKNNITVTSSSVKVNWDKVKSAKGYYVYRKSGSGSWKKIATVKSGSTVSYKDKSAKGAYQYAVKAYTTYNGKTLTSALSASVKARVLAAPKISISGYNDELKNKITWKKISGATGYEVYQKIGEKGKWSRLASFTNAQGYVSPELLSEKDLTGYVTATVSHGKFYYYKVRAVYKSGAAVSYGSFSGEKRFRHCYYPEVDSYMSTDEDSDCAAVGIGLINYGVGKIRIYSKDAMLIDPEYASLDRTLQLYDENAKPCEYIDIKAGEEKVFAFVVNGDTTYYDGKTEIKFKMYYDGFYYWCYVGANSGFSYYDYE